MVEIESTRDIKGPVSVEKRYYISNHHAQPDVISNAVRQHWGVENKLHWVLGNVPKVFIARKIC